MEFTKKFLLKVINEDFDENEGIEVIYDKIIDNGRWTIDHELIFKYNDKFYKVFYDSPATEMQDGCGFFEYCKDEELIEVDEVVPVEKTIIVYETVE